MLSHNELIQTPEYWLETIQNEIFRQVKTYMDKENLNQTQLAQKLGVTKGYISQILNGNFNFTLKKLIDLSISIGIVPDLKFKQMNKFIEEQTKCKIFYLDNNQSHEFKTDDKVIGIADSIELKQSFANISVSSY